jgi:hypothetical protein
MSPEELDDLKRMLTELEAKFATQAATPLAATRLVPAQQKRPRQSGVTRLVFGHIALTCKQALAQPGLTEVQRMYLMEIARICKRMLERDGRDA